MKKAIHHWWRIFRMLEKSMAIFLIFVLTIYWMYAYSFDFPIKNSALNINSAEATAAISIDTTVSTAQAEHNGPSPTDVWISDSTGYTFYVDSNGTASYAKSTNGGASWNTAVTVDSQTDVAGVAVWYEQWSPGDTTGTVIHILTWDTADLYYRTLDTNGDTLSSSSLNITSTNQGGAFAAGANAASLTRSYSGGSYYLYAGIVDNNDSFVIKCSSGCTSSASNWTEAGTNPFTSADGDWLILMPLPSLDLLAIWWDASADDILSREYEDGANAWQGSWTPVRSDSQTAAENTTYDAAFAATIDINTGDIFLAYIDDANALGTDDDIKTSTYDGSSWTDGGEVVSNDPYRGLTGIALSYDLNTGNIYVIFSAQETNNHSYSANIYYSISTDGMSTWSSEYGPLNNVSSDYYGLRSNLFNTERIFASWYGIMYDDLFGHTVADLTPGEDHTYIGYQGSQTLGFSPGTTDNYIGAAFTAIRDSGSGNIDSITISETGTIDAQTYLSNMDIRYETAATCTYDGTETLYGTDTSFNVSDQATVTGTMSVGTSQVCIYVIFDIATSAAGTLDIEIDDPSNDVIPASGVIEQSGRVKLVDPSNIEQPEMRIPVTIDSTVSTTANEHAGPSPTTVFTTDQIGYNFYVDSDGRGKYSKTTDGGLNWGTAVIFDNQTDVLNISVWFDQWSPGDSSGTQIHIISADAADLYYTVLDTNSDSQSTTLNITSSNQGGGFAAGANTSSVTRSYSGGSYYIYAGIIDNSDSFVVKCSSGCTASLSNWTEAGTNPFTSAANDYLILMPLDNLDCLAIWWDASADDIISREFEDGANAWQGSWTQVNTASLNADENTYYDAAYGATVDQDTGNIYLVYVDDNGFVTDNSNSDILASVYDGASWTTKTEAITNDARIISQVAISYDLINDYVYIVYSTINDWDNFRSASIYSMMSTDGMNTWSAEKGTLTQYSNREILALRTNIVNSNRLYVMWYGAAADTIWGTTIRDLADYTQSAYRFFDNADSTDVGSAVDSQDTASTLSSGGQQFRLRLAIDISQSQLEDTGEYFKLQYAGKGAGSCASPAGTPSSYTDVTDSTLIAYAGNSPSDGVALTDNANDPVHSGHTNVNQTYEEANNFSNTEAGISTGEDGLWDFSLIDGDAPDSTTYCFRVLMSDGLALNTYSVYPEVTTGATVTVSISIADGTVTYGLVTIGDAASTTADGIDNTQTITNDGGVIVDLDIKGQDSAAWTLASSPGSEQYTHQYCISGGGSPDPCDGSPTWVNLTTSYSAMTTGLAVSGTQKFDLKIFTPTATATFSQQSVDVTVLASDGS